MTIWRQNSDRPFDGYQFKIPAVQGAVGMCSVAKCFSAFACSGIGVFDDFYIEPVFRRQVIARKLMQAWSKETGLASLTVASAPCDEKMYQTLEFDARPGTHLHYTLGERLHRYRKISTSALLQDCIQYKYNRNNRRLKSF